ncbi:hypothetical protein HBI56_035010 [Parastagonospora nodorum]|uniref:Uncharacterized protein n=1 Tax=Phaeosphaeria nodorum (strain SN15 / ATCC MYA-4574 / FGSC 10173) TaxID=321614 RepID=A0A7U2EYT9_PHANO|nr:hypothetical protein HBH56_022820 [Parastagonospora nodorum]QRC95618.1 hypothetical protein JI435_407640 [Parastagonospora nodorum SN15]KAH3936854.1 hypothetical protein HBH54_011640 [Parastagonospora nodorum]KAH3944123.1 hypothetical protein HBH53_165070 [Parastagonospora nodorum]KAH3967740.1 hypothetical protein HBH51_135090 [Parastagonospora nodorum]
MPASLMRKPPNNTLYLRMSPCLWKKDWFLERYKLIVIENEKACGPVAAAICGYFLYLGYWRNGEGRRITYKSLQNKRVSCLFFFFQCVR